MPGTARDSDGNSSSDSDSSLYEQRSKTHRTLSQFGAEPSESSQSPAISAPLSGSSLFGSSSASISGSFSGAAKPQSFGVPSGHPSCTQAFGLFGAPTGTTVKFEPVIGQDSIMKNGMNCLVNTKSQHITAMKVYQNQSIEELRVEDYLAGRTTLSTTDTKEVSSQSMVHNTSTVRSDAIVSAEEYASLLKRIEEITLARNRLELQIEKVLHRWELALEHNAKIQRGMLLESGKAGIRDESNGSIANDAIIIPSNIFLAFFCPPIIYLIYRELKRSF